MGTVTFSSERLGWAGLLNYCTGFIYFFNPNYTISLVQKKEPGNPHLPLLVVLKKTLYFWATAARDCLGRPVFIPLGDMKWISGFIQVSCRARAEKGFSWSILDSPSSRRAPRSSLRKTETPGAQTRMGLWEV